MSCQVKRNSNNEITLVTNKEGKESKLFNTIAKHPLIENKEKALEVYKNIYTDKFSDDENGVAFTNKLSDGTKTTSYKEALKNSQENEIIEVGFEKDGEFTSIVKTVKNTDQSTKEGFVNFFIENGMISEQKAGDKFQGEGNTDLEQTFNALEIERLALANLGQDSIKRDAFAFTLQQTKGKQLLKLKNGEEKYLSKEEVEQMDVNDFDNPNDAILFKNSKITPYRENFKITPQTESEKDLQIKLLDLLNKLGVNIISISDYLKNYKSKNGINPSAKALADITQKVIALEEGSASMEDFVEEVAHFIESATSMDKKENILRNIHKTEEWAEHSQAYFNIYEQDGYSGQELDNIVRREILGKVIKNSVLDYSNRNEEQKNIFQKAFEFIKDFIDSLKVSSELKDYLQEINNSIETNDSQNTLDLNRESQSAFTFYSTETKTPEAQLRKSSEKLLAQLNNTATALQSTKVFSKVDVYKLKEIESEIENQEAIHSISTLIDVTYNKTKYLEKAIEDSELNNKAYALSIEETILFKELTNNFAKSIAEIKQGLLNSTFADKNEKIAKTLVDRIDETIKSLSSLEAKKSLVENQTIERIVDELINSNARPESDREYYKSWMNSQLSDVSLMSSYFGTLVNSKDGMLGLLGQTLVNVHQSARSPWMNNIKQWQDEIQKLGYTEKDISQFLSGSYIISNRDFNKFDQDKDKAYVEAYRELRKDSKLSDEAIIELRNKGKVDLTFAEETKLKQLWNAKTKDLIENPRKEDFYKKIEEKYDTLGISEDSKIWLGNYLSSVSAYTTAARDKEGRIDYSALSLQDRQELELIQKKRKTAKDYYNSETGELKQGLTAELVDGKLEYSISDGASKEAVLAWDLNRLDKQTVEEFKTQNKNNTEIPQSFKDALKGKSRQEQLDFIKLNAFLGFTDEYYEALGKFVNSEGEEQNKESLYSKLEGKDDELALEMARVRSQISAILKANTQKTNPSEIEVETMSETAKDRVKELHLQMSNLLNQANEVLKEGRDEEQLSRELEVFSQTNESFKREIATKETFKEKFKFILDNTTETDANLIRRVQFSIDDFIKGNRIGLPKSLNRVLDSLDITETDVKNSSKLKEQVLLEYAQQKLLPYYKRMSTPEYSSIIEKLSNEAIDINEILYEIERSQYLKLSPNYSYYTQEEDDSQNPNYVKNSKMGAQQPRVDMYRNEEFYKMFGQNTVLNEDGTIDENTSSNKKLAQLYNITWKTNVAGLEQMGVGNGYNFYTAPQIRKMSLERWQSNIKGVQNIKNGFKDFFTFTDDDLIKGDTTFGTEAKLIPKPYTRMLEDREDISTNLFTSIAMRNKEGFKRNSLVRHSGEIMAIFDKIQTREQFQGKPTETTNAYKQAKSAVDYALLGIKEEFTLPVTTPLGTADLAKTFQQFNKYLRFKNLGFSVIIPTVARLTALVTKQTERWVGQYIEERSDKMAQADIRKNLTDAFKEAGQINTNAYLNVAMQFFGAVELEESLHNSNYGWLARMMPRTSMMLYGAGMYSIFANTTMYALNDTRIVDGKVLNYTDFRASRIRTEKDGKFVIGDEKAIKQEWQNYEAKAIKNYISVENGQLKFDEAKLQEELNSEDIAKSIEDISNKIRTQVKNLNIRIDTQLSPEDKSKAQRSALLSFFMIHRGFLVTATENRFKGYGFNTQTRQWEEGSYASLWNFCGGIVKEWNANGRNLIKAVKTEWNEASNEADFDKMMVRRQNLKRVLVDAAFLNALMLLGLVVRGYAEEPENKDLFALQAANLLLYRTITENNSTGLGIGSTYTGVMDAPLMAYDSAKSILDIHKLFNSDVIKTGANAGRTGTESYLLKNLPIARQFTDLQDLNKKYNTLKYFTEVKSNQLNTIPAYTIFNTEK